MTNQWIPVLVRPSDLDEVVRIVAEREAERTANGSNAGGPVEIVLNTTATSIPRQGTSSAAAGPGPAGSGSPSNGAPHSVERLYAAPSWDAEDLARIADGKFDTTRRWTMALDFCAESPGVWFSTTAIAENTNMSVNEWRDACRKISRHLAIHYPNVPVDENGDAYWPMRAGEPNGPNPNGEVWWAITEEMAELWKSIRNG